MQACCSLGHLSYHSGALTQAFLISATALASGVPVYSLCVQALGSRLEGSHCTCCLLQGFIWGVSAAAVHCFPAFSVAAGRRELIQVQVSL